MKQLPDWRRDQSFPCSGEGLSPPERNRNQSSLPRDPAPRNSPKDARSADAGQTLGGPKVRGPHTLGGGGEGGAAAEGSQPVSRRHRWDLRPRSPPGRQSLRTQGGAPRGTPSWAGAPRAQTRLPRRHRGPGTGTRGQRQRRLRERPSSRPGPPAAHLRVSPPPSAPTEHPAGPGGGCSAAAPTGPRAARPGLPAPGTDAPGARLAPAPGSRRSAEKEGDAERRPPLPHGKPAPERRLCSSLRRWSGPAPPPGSHFGSGGPVAITAQQLTRRRSGAGSGGGGGGGGARQGGSSRGRGGGAQANLARTFPRRCHRNATRGCGHVECGRKAGA